MDLERIQKLTDEVLSQLGAERDREPGGDLEARVANLERIVLGQRDQQTPRGAATVQVAVTPAVIGHPSHHVLRVLGGVAGEPCLLEPDKPCTSSRRCQTLGY